MATREPAMWSESLTWGIQNMRAYGLGKPSASSPEAAGQRGASRTGIAIRRSGAPLR